MVSPPGVVRSDTVVTTVLVRWCHLQVLLDQIRLLHSPGVVRSDTVVTSVLVTV